jgi:hypothetical protein
VCEGVCKVWGGCVSVRNKPIPVVTYNVTYTATGAVLTASSNVKPSKVELVCVRERVWACVRVRVGV